MTYTFKNLFFHIQDAEVGHLKLGEWVTVV